MGAIESEFLPEVERAVADALNMVAADVFFQSQVEVPKATDPKVIASSLERFGMTLVESGRFGGGKAGPRGGTYELGRGKHVDLALRAEPGHLIAEVIYESPYALAQHEGEMTYQRNGKEIEWVVERYSTFGTKKHFVSDPLKASVAELNTVTGEMLDGLCAAATEASRAALEEFERTGVMRL